MKRIISVLMVMVAVAIVVPLQAQIKFGVKGGLNLANTLSDTWKDKANADNYTGFFIGPMVDLTVPIVGLGVDGALMYSQKGNKLGGGTLKQQGIEIPVNLKYSLGLGSLASVYLAAGPSFFFNFKSDDNLTLESVTDKVKYENAEIALNLGVGVKLLKHLQVGVNYNMPFTESAKAGIADKDYTSEAWKAIRGKSFKTKVWQVSVAYMF
ncbi:MAG: porin family protein [Mediterranea sp.]|jgi:hypothetical protein|nr:porin family protein [Mediterranea sp.]